nr:type-F conjugative transfer system protein TrbI [Porphyrobacter sp. HT-58-2]
MRRAGRPPEEIRMRVDLYLKAVEASVAALGREGRTVLVAEAVVSGSAPDLTESVRADVARRIGGGPDARR